MKSVDRLLLYTTARDLNRSIEDEYRQACYNYLLQRGWSNGQLQLHSPSYTDGLGEAPNSCDWISNKQRQNFKSPVMQDWHTFIASDSSGLLMVTGPIGAGKTFLAASITRQLQEESPTTSLLFSTVQMMVFTTK